MTQNIVSRLSMESTITLGLCQSLILERKWRAILKNIYRKSARWKEKLARSEIAFSLSNTIKKQELTSIHCMRLKSTQIVLLSVLS